MTLYHYTSGQGIFGILNSGELHCSNVNFLNDPSEESYFSDLLNLVLKESKGAETICSALHNKSFIDAVVDPYDRFIASFSKNNDSLSMWNYYSKGNGYNLGLDIDEVIKANSNGNIYIQKIELMYDKAKQIEETITFILGQKENHNKYLEIEEKINTIKNEDEYYSDIQDQHELIGAFNNGIHSLKLGYKHQAYEREEEVRLIISELGFENRTTRFKASDNGVFIEYLPIKLYLNSYLRSVTIHPLCGPLHLQGTKKIIKSLMNDNKPEINISTIPFRIV